MIVQTKEVVIIDDKGSELKLKDYGSRGLKLYQPELDFFYLETQAEVIKFIEAIKEIAGIEDKI